MRFVVAAAMSVALVGCERHPQAGSYRPVGGPVFMLPVGDIRLESGQRFRFAYVGLTLTGRYTTTGDSIFFAQEGDGFVVLQGTFSSDTLTLAAPMSEARRFARIR